MLPAVDGGGQASALREADPLDEIPHVPTLVPEPPAQASHTPAVAQLWLSRCRAAGAIGATTRAFALDLKSGDLFTLGGYPPPSETLTDCLRATIEQIHAQAAGGMTQFEYVGGGIGIATVWSARTDMAFIIADELVDDDAIGWFRWQARLVAQKTARSKAAEKPA